jgi:hypothetical protein
VQLNIESGQKAVEGTEFQGCVSRTPAEAKLLAALGRGWRPGDKDPTTAPAKVSAPAPRRWRLAQLCRKNSKIPVQGGRRSTRLLVLKVCLIVRRSDSILAKEGVDAYLT